MLCRGCDAPLAACRYTDGYCRTCADEIDAMNDYYKRKAQKRRRTLAEWLWLAASWGLFLACMYLLLARVH